MTSFRLGLPGLLTSQELRDAGYQANNQLRDQLLALQWIRSHIEGFGGDPQNITVMGVSTGSGELFGFGIGIGTDRSKSLLGYTYSRSTSFPNVRS